MTKHVKSIMVLAFGPITDLTDAFYILSDNLPNVIINLVDWFKDFI